ncbi:MAG: SPOR domain-containing protein [Pseudoxanthomonas sp.]
MAARRNKSQARRTGGGGGGTPGWVWLVVGVVLGAVLLFTVPGLLKKDGDGFFRPQPNPNARPVPVAESEDDSPAETAPRAAAATAAKPAAEDAPKETQYDFYTLLPGKEVRMSDAELAAGARAEQERQRQWAAQQARAAQADNPPADTTAPRPIDETPAPVQAVVAAPKPVVETAKPASTPAATTVASAAPAAAESNARYILQAGAFGASGDAESTKAKIAMLGLSARVESAQIGDKTVYRVRMGPYGSASELADAKQKLANGGLPAMAIKAQ